MELPTEELTPKQKGIYDFIVAFRAEHDQRSPTYREIGDGCGMKSTAHVDYQVKQAIAKGYLRQTPGVARSLVPVVFGESEPK